jgi:uncharacterized protein (TIGR02118 family)
MKLVALYRRPADPASFDEKYFDTHLPLISKVPGLQNTVITKFMRTVMGDDLYMMAEMTFADLDSLKAGMKSPEMAEAGQNLNSFAEGLVTLLYGEEHDEVTL